MKCPYCEGTNNFNNTSINHKYKHDDCGKYFKRCPICNTTYADANYKNNTSENIKWVDNLYSVDICEVCNRAWLPDFPTSWTRSLTNVGKIYEVLKDLGTIMENGIDKDKLFQIQSRHNGVIFNPLRARDRGIDDYIEGSSVRRMDEYINFFLFSQVLKKENDKRKFTKYGVEFLNSDSGIDLLSFYITTFYNIKFFNKYTKKSKSNPYSFFNISFMYNILKVSKIKNDENQNTTKYDFGLAVLSRNSEQFETLTKKYIKDYSQENIRDFFFNDQNRELNRAVISTFINIYISIGLLSKKGDSYKITSLGEDILTYIEKRPSLWFEKFDDNIVDIFSKIIIWRLVRNDLISDDNLIVSINSIEEEISEKLELDFSIIHDIHLNLFYDELEISEESSSEIILLKIQELLGKENFDLIQIEDLCETLPVMTNYEISNIVSRHSVELEEIVNKFNEDYFGDNSQSGGKWHDKTRTLFDNMGLNCINYKEMPLFRDLIIDGLNIDLPGGTVHNPDMLIIENGFGKENCILVDSKDQNSIKSEVHKLRGYSIYANHEDVDTYCIIAVRGTVPQIVLSTINDNIENFKRVVVIEEAALEFLARNPISKSEIFTILFPNENFRHITLNQLQNDSQMTPENL